MRNLNYEKAHEVFTRISTLSSEKPYSVKDLIRELEGFLSQLDVTFGYASDAIRGLKRRKLKKYKFDKNIGVMEEEIVLCYFLEELISSTRFLKKRLETDLKIRIYRERIKRFQSQTPGGDGFLSNILQSLEDMSKTEFIEIEKLILIMDERYNIGNKLFSIIREKASGNTVFMASAPLHFPYQ